MNRLRSAIYRWWYIIWMLAYTLLAPCSTGACNLPQYTLAGAAVLLGTVGRQRWATLLTLGVLCLALTTSRAYLGPLPACVVI